ncbi:protein phosphatase CheZ [Undibacterium sp. SXout7W]|uniref:protein phosphatase CheZ n=1 Tax=Undibacterium sp. SXout7W TaxID=3413049 RepID=UPI003BF1FAB3
MNDISIEELAVAPEVEVFGRLGGIVRSLHDALNEIGAGHVLAEAVSEFPSARERLVHIASLTENAANKVLTKVEETSPMQQRLSRQANDVQQKWDAVDFDTLDATGFAELKAATSLMLSATQLHCDTTYAALSDIMMAQDFQDLTGQLIKKVVGLLTRTENDLLRLLIDAAPPGTMSVVKKEEIMAGPGAPGSVALEQTDVDDLLADLGF